MLVFALFSITTLVFYLKSKFGNENEEILTMTTYCLGISTAITSFLILTSKKEPQTDLIYLFLIPFFVFGIYYIGKKNPTKIP